MKKNIILTLLLAGLITIKASSVNAQLLELPLQVAPARQEIQVEPGDKTTVYIRFFNLSDTTITGILKAGDFIVTGDSGIPRIVDNPSFASPRFSASTWFDLPYDKMAIGANDKVEIQANISVPKNARPGGRYVAVYFESSANAPSSVTSPQAAGASITPRIAGLVYIRVKGPITEKALISRLFAPSFLEYGPISVEAEIINRGDYHIRPRGSYTLINMLGGIVDQKKLTEANIFPDASRSYVVDIGDKWMIGKYTIKLSAAYGETGQIINRTISVWMFPWKVALIVVLALIILIIFIRHLYKDLVVKESELEKKLEKEQSEVDKLRKELLKKS